MYRSDVELLLMKQNQQSKEVEPHNSYWCETCNNNVEMTHEQAVEHLQNVHKIDTKKTPCQRETIMHMDGDTWYSWKYKITIKAPNGDVILTNESLSARDEDDPMRYA